ncbi:MAG: D-3-phosphoglycerate dehydrogenase [Parcubacteria bacterium C7867-006]|nr:MAG: D-3-phosphoglycerate dehydrogenase [Parcubacteria bacterium C7867-006]
MNKIFLTRKIPEVGIKMLEEKGFELDIYPDEHAPSHEELLERLKSSEYVGLVSLLTDKIDSSVFDASPNIKIVANYATGFNNIDVEEAKKRGVVVTNTPGVSALAVAEHTVALMLALTTRLVEGDLFMREGKFKGWTPYNFVGTDLSGKTIGLIGVGNIGGRVAHILKGFGVNVIYNDVAKNEKIESDCGAVFYSDVNELLKAADIVSLHVPLMDSTHHLINESHLKIMKPTAFLINTSRGPVVDEVALVEALKNKTIAGAGLDVFEFEPNLADGLKDLQNVVLTPHIASARESARNDMAVLAAQSIVDFFEGNEVKNKVG